MIVPASSALKAKPGTGGALLGPIAPQRQRGATDLASQGIILERNSVFFRFASEPQNESLPFVGREITVGDLKQAIAERRGLQRYDLVLYREDTNTAYEKDGAMIPRNTRILVRRRPPQNQKKPAVIWVEANLTDEPEDEQAKAKKQKQAPKKPIVKVPLPVEYMCPVCDRLFDNPHIGACCGRSCCKTCWDNHFENKSVMRGNRKVRKCPMCTDEWEPHQQPIPNLRLADCCAALDLDYFIMPGEDPKETGKEETDAAPLGQASGSSPSSASGQPAQQAPPSATPQQQLPPAPFPQPGPPPCLPPPAAAAPTSHATAVPQAPPGMTLRPVALTPEQFYAWQQSLKQKAADDSGSEAHRRRRKRKGHRHDNHGEEKEHRHKSSKRSRRREEL